VTESYIYFVVVLLLSVVLAALVMRPIENRLSKADHAAGAALVWCLFALVTGLWMSGTSYLFVWPVIAASLILGCKPSGSAKLWVHSAGVTVVAATAILLLAPAVDIFIQMAQPRPLNTDSQMIPLMGVAVALATMVIVLIHPHLSRSGKYAPREPQRCVAAFSQFGNWRTYISK
jgi:hypothetical protein